MSLVGNFEAAAMAGFLAIAVSFLFLYFVANVVKRWRSFNDYKKIVNRIPGPEASFVLGNLPKV